MSYTITQFRKEYPTRAKKEAALKKMSNKKIDELVASCSTKQAKICYSAYKK